MTNIFGSALVVLAVSVLLASPASATHKAGHEGTHGKSWISDIQTSDDSESGYRGPAPLTVVDSTGALVGVVGQYFTNNSNAVARAIVGVRLEDGRVANVAAFRNYLAGDGQLYSESDDCSEPLYRKVGSRGPNGRMSDRSGIANGLLYVEAENGVMSRHIQGWSTWDISNSTCRSYHGRSMSAVQMFPVKALNYLPPFKIE